MVRQTLAVSDANVLIDIQEGGLLDVMFNLPGLSFCVPDVLFESLYTQEHSKFEDRAASKPRYWQIAKAFALPYPKF